MKPARITVLIEHLLSLFSAVSPELRFDALETILARARFTPGTLGDSDAVRFRLFGLDHNGPLAVAALTCLSDRSTEGDATWPWPGDSYFLRADPVTLHADLSSVLMTGLGFADLEKNERLEIEKTVLGVFREEGLTLVSRHPERWTVLMEKPLEYSFPSLQTALGMDVAEALPDHPEARYWRRLLNEIQMVLHANPVNRQRRQQGMREINSVWFWGAGSLPARSTGTGFERVYSDHPVSRGLALHNEYLLHGLGALQGHAEALGGQARLLVDWTPHPGTVEEQIQRLDKQLAALIQIAEKRAAVLHILSGDGSLWAYDRSCAMRFWRRKSPVSHWAGRP